MILSEDCKYQTPFKKNNYCYEKCSLTELEQKTRDIMTEFWMNKKRRSNNMVCGL